MIKRERTNRIRPFYGLYFFMLGLEGLYLMNGTKEFYLYKRDVQKF